VPSGAPLFYAGGKEYGIMTKSAKTTAPVSDFSAARSNGMLLSAEHISKNYGTKQLLQDASCYLNEKDKIGIIGINGTGKSTLLKILAGTETPDSGIVTVQRGACISFLPQNPEMDDSRTVLQQAMAQVSPSFPEVNEYEVKAILTKLGMNDCSTKIGTLSGGQKKRVALAATLSCPADILILDEPTNHLDSEMVMWLEDRLARFTGGLIMVTHDRYFLERVVNHITELSHGKLYTYEANYSKYLQMRMERQDMEQAGERKRQAFLRREYQWIMRGARARGTKSRGRIEKYNAVREQAAPVTDGQVQMVTMSSRLGKKLIELSDVSKSFDGSCVVSHFSYNVKRSDRIGIVGRNGAGKSTLMNLIAGRLQPDTGKVDIGSTVKIGYFTQEGKEMDSSQLVYDYISEIAGEVKTAEGTFSAAQMLERFLFTSDLQYTPIGRLSGGERRRLYLLGILVSAPNILLLDEPTNDLDIATLTILENYLTSFAGAVIAVSHDRYFLDKVAGSIFEVADGGDITCYNGSFSDYLEKRPAPPTEKKEHQPAGKPKPRAADKPQQLKMSFSEQHELKTIDDEVAALEGKVHAKEKEVETAASDYTRLVPLTQELEDLKQQLDEKNDRWLYLNDLAERIGAQNTEK
jgi:ATP-binding cassette subfamily F protein uup